MKQYGITPTNSKMHGSHCNICHPDIESNEGRAKARESAKKEILEEFNNLFAELADYYTANSENLYIDLGPSS